MLTLSKPISAGQAQAYHKSEFANAKENYYTEGERVRGEWQGQLAARYGLRGEVNEEQFARLSEGQHPATGEALIRRQQARDIGTRDITGHKGDMIPIHLLIPAMSGTDGPVRMILEFFCSVGLDFHHTPGLYR